MFYRVGYLLEKRKLIFWLMFGPSLDPAVNGDATRPKDEDEQRSDEKWIGGLSNKRRRFVDKAEVR
jgi:hypothetical protein